MAVSSTSWDCRPAQSTPSTSLCPTSLEQCGSTPQSGLSLVSWCLHLASVSGSICLVLMSTHTKSKGPGKRVSKRYICRPSLLPLRPSFHPTSGPHPHCWWTDCPTDCHVPRYQGGHPPVLHLNVTITSQQTSDRTAAPPCYQPDHSHQW